MSRQIAAYLIHFDETRRHDLLQEVHDLAGGFSDALSSNDWPIRQWEVCGLLFAPERITHWALARKGKHVATGKVRVEFSEVTPTNIPITDIVQRVGTSARRNIISSRSGAGGAVPPKTWRALKQAVAQIDAESFQTIERLERLRNQRREYVIRPGAEVLAQQRDAVGLALDVFDRTGALRKNTFHEWAVPAGKPLNSFLDNLPGVHVIEDQLIARDAAAFPGSDAVRPTTVGAVFSSGNRKLEVFNVNRTAVEHALGVDLLYFHEAFDAWTMVQYKSMECAHDAPENSAIYRPDDRFYAELARMTAFRSTVVDHWQVSDGKTAYRLSGEGFFFKFCPRIRLKESSEALLSGMYLAQEHVQAILADPAASGPKGGKQITFENTGRYLNNTLFADLLRDGWIGTRTVSSARIAQIVRDSLSAKRSIVLARERRTGEPANVEQTLADLNL